MWITERDKTLALPNYTSLSVLAIQAEFRAIAKLKRESGEATGVFTKI